MKSFVNCLKICIIILMVMMFLGAGCYPSIAGDLEVEDSALSIAINKTLNRVFIADSTKGVKVMNVSDPENPVKVSEYSDADKALKIKNKENLCFLSEFLEGILVLDFSDPDSVEQQLVESSILPNSMIVKNNILYVGDLKDGFLAYTINSENPWLTLTGICSDTTSVMSACVSETENKAFVVDTGKGLMAIDTSIYDSMHQIGNSLDSIKTANDMLLVGNYIYLATMEGIKVIDVSNPSNMNVIGSFGLSTLSLYVDGDFLYAACGEDGLYKYDISNRTSPVQTFRKTFGFSRPVMDVVTNGNYAYIAAEKGGLIVCQMGE